MSTELSTELTDKQFVKEQVGIFESIRPNFEIFTKLLIATLEQGRRKMPEIGIIQGRVKETASFAEKCLRKRKNNRHPAWQLTDLCGVRIIVKSKDQIKPVCRFILEHFHADETEDTAERLKDMEFGYQSVHFVVSLKPGVHYFPETLTIPDALFTRRDNEETEKTGLPIGAVYKAEVQVRTLLQHAWSELAHDNLYKTEFTHKPRHLTRESGRIAALLEDADGAFVRLIDGVETYRSCYGAYMEDKEIRREIEVQKVILSFDPGNKAIALKIARLIDNLHDESLHSIAEEVLLPFAGQGDADIHRELGKAQWRLKKKEGQANLLEATKLNPADADNWCELGRTYFAEKDYYKALPSYEAAFRAKPEYPRALLRFVECRIVERSDFSFIPLIRHIMEKAIEISRQKIQAGMHLPWAWFDTAFFELLLGRPFRSLDAYGKAIALTTSPSPVEDMYNSLTEIHKKAVQGDPELARNLQWVRAYLRVILFGRYRKDVQCLRMCDERLDGCRSKVTSTKDVPVYAPDQSFAIVAGSCGVGDETLSDFSTLILSAFDGFSGDLFCGGTTAGISGIIGSLPDPQGRIRKIAYLPTGHPATDVEHPQYHIIRTTDSGYSPMDPIMLWEDLLACGVNPQNVRLLGVGGGEIAAFEYRLGLIVGATVAVIPESGRAAAAISEDEDWRRAAAAVSGDKERRRVGLVQLPADTEFVRAFVQPVRPSKMLDAETREAMARSFHEDYCAQRLTEQSKQPASDSMAAWNELEETYKRSNLDLVDQIEAKLKRIHLAMRRVPSGSSPKIHTIEADKIKILNEMEHGRWGVERFMDGWVFGEKRDNDRKIHHLLIPWDVLPEEERAKDNDTIQLLPEILARFGFEIFDPGKE